MGVLGVLRLLPRYIFHFLRKKHHPYRWFDLDRGIKLHFVPFLYERFAPKTDLYVATAVETSIYLNDYKQVDNKNKFYFIQDFENWDMSDRKVMIVTNLTCKKCVFRNGCTI